MTAPERRVLPRTILQRLAYLHIEPDNGGIVLNISTEGLCFHSIAPIERNGAFRFSLFEHNRSIDASGELAWVDSPQSNAGVRFTELRPEARDVINEWIAQPRLPLEESPAPSSKFALPRKPQAVEKSPSDRQNVSVASPSLSAAVQRLRLRVSSSGFSSGFAAGLFLSALAAGIFFFSYAHRRELGNSMIRLGQRLAARPEVQRPTALPEPVASPSVAAPSVTPTRVPHDQTPTERREQERVEPEPVVTKRPERKLEPSALRVAVPPELDNRPTTHRAVSGTRDTISTPAAPLVGMPPPASLPTSVPNNIDTIRSMSSAGSPGDSGMAGAMFQMYLDLGTFKDELLAHDVSGRVAKLGLPTSVVRRRQFWSKSYQVLVGPYDNAEQEMRIRKDLVSQGYEPHPYEKGSRSFMFVSRVNLQGARLPAGDFIISWESSYAAKTKVKFAHGRDVILTEAGKWINLPEKYSRDEYVCLRHGDGSRTLLEIHFSGLNRALVFR